MLGRAFERRLAWRAFDLDFLDDELNVPVVPEVDEGLDDLGAEVGAGDALISWRAARAGQGSL